MSNPNIQKKVNPNQARRLSSKTWRLLRTSRLSNLRSRLGRSVGLGVRRIAQIQGNTQLARSAHFSVSAALLALAYSLCLGRLPYTSRVHPSARSVGWGLSASRLRLTPLCISASRLLPLGPSTCPPQPLHWLACASRLASLGCCYHLLPPLCAPVCSIASRLAPLGLSICFPRPLDLLPSASQMARSAAAMSAQHRLTDD